MIVGPLLAEAVVAGFGAVQVLAPVPVHAMQPPGVVLVMAASNAQMHVSAGE